MLEEPELARPSVPQLPIVPQVPSWEVRHPAAPWRMESARKDGIENHETCFADMERREGNGLNVGGGTGGTPACWMRSGKQSEKSNVFYNLTPIWEVRLPSRTPAGKRKDDLTPPSHPSPLSHPSCPLPSADHAKMGKTSLLYGAGLG